MRLVDLGPHRAELVGLGRYVGDTYGVGCMHLVDLGPHRAELVGLGLRVELGGDLSLDGHLPEIHREVHRESDACT